MQSDIYFKKNWMKIEIVKKKKFKREKKRNKKKYLDVSETMKNKNKNLQCLNSNFSTIIRQKDEISIIKSI